MAKVSRDGYNQLLENIKQPLEHLYNKLEAEGVFSKVGGGEVYESIYKFLDTIEAEWIDESMDVKTIRNVMIDGDEYRKVGR
tara:strand:+ start:238 stop:483 length:246 start_codon:yes stop_codon:yes gene_type:complete